MQTNENNNLAQLFKGASLLRFEDKLRQIAATEIEDIDEAAGGCVTVGAEEFSAPMEIDLPGRGKCSSMLVRNPGSGALQELFQVL